MKRLIYADHAATTPLSRAAFDVINAPRIIVESMLRITFGPECVKDYVRIAHEQDGEFK